MYHISFNHRLIAFFSMSLLCASEKQQIIVIVCFWVPVSLVFFFEQWLTTRWLLEAFTARMLLSSASKHCEYNSMFNLVFDHFDCEFNKHAYHVCTDAQIYFLHIDIYILFTRRSFGFRSCICAVLRMRWQRQATGLLCFSHSYFSFLAVTGVAFALSENLLTTIVCCRYSKKCSQKILAAVDPSLAKEPVKYSRFEM